MEWNKLFNTVRSSLLTWALVVSLLLTALIGVLVIVNDSRDGRRTECITRYNMLVAEAREDRLEAQVPVDRSRTQYLTDDLNYQKALLDRISGASQVSTDEFTRLIERRIEINETYLEELRQQQATIVVADYPPADLCEDP